MLIQRRGGSRGADPNGSVYAGAIHFPAQCSNPVNRGLDAQLFHFANKNHVRKWSSLNKREASFLIHPRGL